jgi:6-phosphogluconolactonase
MSHTIRRRLLPVASTLALAALVLIGIAGSASAGHVERGSTHQGSVYVLSNSAAGNHVLAFGRAADGTLSSSGRYSTGGLGSGASLGSQGALVWSGDGRWLLAVNAGSDDVSIFRARAGGLTLRDVAPSGGAAPISLDVSGRLVYVLNDGTDDVSGLRITDRGTLRPIRRSTRGLSGDDVSPAQVSFTPGRRHVIVTEKNTNSIDTYKVRANGRLRAPIVQDSAGETPFGFDFASRKLVVSEASASALSSYDVARDGILGLVSASVEDTQSAACWVVATSDGRFAYTTNAGSASISSYEIARGGRLGLLEGVAGSTGAGPNDADVSAGDGYLYSVNTGDHSISGFKVHADGSLSSVGEMSGLPASALGLAAS